MYKEEVKRSILKRLIAGRKGVPVYDVKITDYCEEKAGVYVTFSIEGEKQHDVELITWWTIAFSA